MPSKSPSNKRRRRGRVVLDGRSLTLEQVESVADGAPCRLAAEARREVCRSRAVVERAVASGEQVYGVNTGFGKLAKVRIPDDKLDQLQQNLIRSHAAGVGAPLPERVVHHGVVGVDPHAAGVRTLVIIEGALVVLRGRKRQDGLAISQHDEGKFLALQALLNNQPGTGVAQRLLLHELVYRGGGLVGILDDSLCASAPLR